MRVGRGAAGKTRRRIERIERRAGETPGERGRPAGPGRPGGVIEDAEFALMERG